MIYSDSPRVGLTRDGQYSRLLGEDEGFWVSTELFSPPAQDSKYKRAQRRALEGILGPVPSSPKPQESIQERDARLGLPLNSRLENDVSRSIREMFLRLPGRSFSSSRESNPSDATIVRSILEEDPWDNWSVDLSPTPRIASSSPETLRERPRGAGFFEGTDNQEMDLEESSADEFDSLDLRNEELAKQLLSGAGAVDGEAVTELLKESPELLAAPVVEPPTEKPEQAPITRRGKAINMLSMMQLYQIASVYDRPTRDITNLLGQQQQGGHLKRATPEQILRILSAFGLPPTLRP